MIDANDEVKLADFGCSNYLEGVRHTYCGTPDYLAPEIILGDPQNEKVDVWALGILLFELVKGKAPFSPNTK